MNDIAKGRVCTGLDARTVRFVFVSICCGVARLTNTRTSQHTPWGLTLPKRKNRKKWKEGQEKKKWWSPPGTEHTKVWPTKAPQNTKRNFPQSKPRSKNMNWWSNRNTWPRVAVRGVLTNQKTCSEVFHMTPCGSQRCWHITVKVLPQNPNPAPMKFHTQS